MSLPSPLHRLFSKHEVERNATHTKCSLIGALRGSLQQLAAGIDSPEVNVDQVNDVIVAVGACLQNFPFGRDALAEEIHAYIALLPGTLHRFWAGLR